MLFDTEHLPVLDSPEYMGFQILPDPEDDVKVSTSHGSTHRSGKQQTEETTLANLMPHDSLFTDIELQRIRNNVIAERIQKWEDEFAIRLYHKNDNIFTTMKIISWQERQQAMQNSQVGLNLVAPLSLQWMLDIQMATIE